MKYIDAKKLRAEIRHMLKDNSPYFDVQERTGAHIALAKLSSFLDTLSEEPDKSMEEAAYKYSLESRPSVYGQVDVIDAFEAGAKWQKEQMLKDAFVDNYVVHDGRIELEGDPLPSLDPILILPYPQFKPGDKVRIVVLKAEEE